MILIIDTGSLEKNPNFSNIYGSPKLLSNTKSVIMTLKGYRISVKYFCSCHQMANRLVQ